MITYAALKSRPSILYRLTGHTQEEFASILDKFYSAYGEYQRQKQFNPKRIRAFGAGRPSHLVTLEDKLLFILVYVRTYPLLFLHTRKYKIRNDEESCVLKRTNFGRS